MKQADIGLGEVQKKPLKELLKHRYEVPFFQREYSWNKDHWVDFYEDLQQSYKNNRGHFFGFMTLRELKAKEGAEYEIIEGQQRLTTVTIFLCVIRDICGELGINELKNTINNQYIFLTDPFGDKDDYYPNLCLSHLNLKFFENYIQGSGTLNDKQNKIKQHKMKNSNLKSNKDIWSCYQYFHDKLSDEIDGLDLKKKEDLLRKYCKALSENFIVIVAYVENAITAYNIFQTINDRGKDLALSDILKIHLCERVTSDDQDASEFIKEFWDDIRSQLVSGNMNSFLRHYWLSTRGVVKETQLLKEITSEISDAKSAYNFLAELGEEVGTYEALNNPTPDNWAGHDKRIASELSDLQYIGPTIPIVLLIASAAVFKDNDKEFVKIIELCNNFLFRYLTIAEQEHKVLEKIFSDLAINLRKKNIKSSSGVRDELLKIDIKDASLQVFLGDKDIKVHNVAKYILQKIETHLDPEQEKFSDKITLEHILPRKPEKVWSEYLSKNRMDHAQFVNKLGNLTLLLGKVNKSAQNKFITEKIKDCYHNSSKLKINEGLMNKKGWTANDIQDRQKWLAKLCLQIWTL